MFFFDDRMLFAMQCALYQDSIILGTYLQRTNTFLNKGAQSRLYNRKYTNKHFFSVLT